MAVTIKQETREIFNTIKIHLKKGETYMPYLSGTINKRTRMYKIIKEICKIYKYNVRRNQMLARPPP